MSVVEFLGPYDNRVAAELPEGYVVGTCVGDCPLSHGVSIQGVQRRIGEQTWTDGRRAMTVHVEDFDLDAAGLRNWSTGVE
ncbi:hypothetical protein [Dyella sedimenti]|uniref:hypothetical protein n=1 Tax=Dyella sedimenti TaxID=2919947 RepID=UPI001FAA0DB0|nr:hypothetical protein [Dyella sedimenti]